MRKRQSRADHGDAEFLDYVASSHEVMERTALALTSGKEADARDLVQATLVELYVRWRRIDDVAARDSYSRTIMVRIALRSQRRAEPTEPMADGEPPVEYTGHPDVGQAVATNVDLDRYLRMLSPRQRAVIVCRYLCDLSEVETARVLRCAPGTVKTHTARALAQLRRAMNDSDHAMEPKR